MQDPSYKREKRERKKAEDFIDSLYDEIKSEHDKESMRETYDEDN
jgi:hypothetical protein